MKKILLLLSLIALPAAAWLAGSSFSGGEEAGFSSRDPAALIPNGASGREGSGTHFSPRAGQTYSYQFQRKIEIQGLNNSFPPIIFGGLLRMEVLDSGPSGFTALVNERLSGQKENGIFLKIRADQRGEYLQIFSSASGTEEARQHESILKDLLSQLFFRLRQDTVGPYEARWESLEGDDLFERVRKTKIGYLSRGQVPEILSSEHIIRWNRKIGMPQDISGRESTRVGKGEGSVSSEASYGLKLRSVSLSRETDRSLLASLSQGADLELDRSRPSLRNHPDWSGINWNDLKNRMLALDELASGEQLKVFGDLLKLLEAEPGHLQAMLDLLRSQDALKAGAESPLFQMVVGVLATTGGPEAQLALVRLYGNPEVPVSGKGSILSSLTTTQAPLESSTRSFLAEVMSDHTNRDLSQGAAFALGSSLGNLPAGTDGSESISRIRSAWEQSQSSSTAEQLAMLDVIGNSGRAEFLPVLRKALAPENDPDLRAKAAFSLRFMGGTEAYSLLIGSLSDPDVKVRTGAVLAMGLAPWSESFRRPLENCVNTESVNEIRSACRKIFERSASALAQAD